jgi:Zinc finger, C3HC4 type (RING finger)
MIMIRTTSPGRTQLPRPTFLDNDDQNIDNHPLHCSICCDVSFNPVITPCQHIFCRDCIESGLRSSLSCPNDRRPLNRNSLQNISGIHEYVYNHSLVKCPRCETWKGQFQQYKVHIPTCNSSTYVQSLEQKIEDLTLRHARELSNLQASISTSQAALAQVRHAAELNTAELNQHHDEEKERLQNQIDTLKSTVSALESRIASMGPIFDVSYRYDESNISDLSRIISRYLYNKPAQIDSNRIFNCIKKCYDGAQYDQSYDMLLSAKMLLVTSYRSTWFTTNQDNRLREWCSSIDVKWEYSW